MEHVLEVRGLIHRYGEHTALAGVDLTVDSGECVALLGPNEAGKTTLVCNVIGLIEGEADLMEVAGGDLRRAETRRKLGVVQQAVGFPRALTVGEIVGGEPPAAVAPRRQPAKPLPRWAWPAWRNGAPTSSPVDSSRGCSLRGPCCGGSDPLTDQEREVLREVGEGHPNIEIAQRLHLAEERCVTTSHQPLSSSEPETVPRLSP